MSFSEEEHEVEQYDHEYYTTHESSSNNDSNGENFEETDFIFSKFKKIADASSTVAFAGLELETQSITLQQLYNKLLELEQSMNAKHAEIMEHLTNVNK